MEAGTIERRGRIETTKPGSANRTYDLGPVGSEDRDYTEGQNVALLIEEHARGFKTLTPDQRARLLEVMPLTLKDIEWAARLPSA